MKLGSYRKSANLRSFVEVSKDYRKQCCRATYFYAASVSS
jgi:hypothetical protein